MSNEYQKGYAAGRGKASKDKVELERLSETVQRLRHVENERRDRIYLSCLEMVVVHCDGWSLGGKKINDAKGYCKLAKIFMDNSISVLSL